MNDCWKDLIFSKGIILGIAWTSLMLGSMSCCCASISIKSALNPNVKLSVVTEV